MINKKASMQLSINMIVTMIIMVVIFSFGIYLFSTLYNKATDLDTQVKEKYIQQIIELNECEGVACVLNPQQDYKGEALTYIIEISNENSINPSDFFKFVEVTTGATSGCTYSECDGTPASEICTNDEYEVSPALEDGTVKIPNNQKDHRLLLFKPKNLNCLYTLKFKIQKSDTPAGSFNDYSSTQILWVYT